MELSLRQLYLYANKGGFTSLPGADEQLLPKGRFGCVFSWKGAIVSVKYLGVFKITLIYIACTNFTRVLLGEFNFQKRDLDFLPKTSWEYSIL
ncbi:hypothetical protein DOZ91_00550 [Peribacillus frigoritolerans]|nr:hypothetical protein DOZ91_00550 [Peribacillus frigoritolerans]